MASFAAIEASFAQEGSRLHLTCTASGTATTPKWPGNSEGEI